MCGHIYFCIDLKTFYASVECVERGLDPFKTNLVVADISRGKGTICLAVSPALKNHGVKNRCRLFEIPSNIKYILAQPRMKKYIEYSANIYAIYLKYIAKEDIFPYSVDEMFLDVTKYIKMYKMSAVSLAKLIINDVFLTTGITATCGIGTNLYLAKIALDILAKHSKTNIAFLDEEKYKKVLWTHTPLSDFWQIGKGIESHLALLGIHTMQDIAKTNPDLLFKHFGVNAEIIIEHAFGKEPTTIADIKSYKREDESISSGQVLFRDYSFLEAKIVLVEMIDNLCLELIEKHKVCQSVSLCIGYSKEIHKKTGGSKKLKINTNVFSVLKPAILDLFEKTTLKNEPIRKINIFFGGLMDEQYEKLDLLINKIKVEHERNTSLAVHTIKRKFGKNAVLRGVSLRSSATQKLRNKLIGGHLSGEE